MNYIYCFRLIRQSLLSQLMRSPPRPSTMEAYMRQIPKSLHSIEFCLLRVPHTHLRVLCRIYYYVQTCKYDRKTKLNANSIYNNLLGTLYLPRAISNIVCVCGIVAHFECGAADNFQENLLGEFMRIKYTTFICNSKNLFVFL